MVRGPSSKGDAPGPLARLGRLAGALLAPGGRQTRALERGRTLEAEGRLDDAAACYDAILKTAPDDLEALCAASALALGQGDSARADALAERAVTAHPQAPEPYLSKAAACVERSAALDVLDAGAAACPNSIDLRRVLARTLLEAGRADDAARHLHAVMRSASRDPDSYVDLAIARLAQGREDDALRLLEQALSFDAGHLRALATLGELRYRGGDWIGALACFEQATGSAPDDPDVAHGLGRARHECGDLGGARSAFERALALAPERTGILATLGCIALEDGDVDGAQAHHLEALARDPEQPNARFGLGMVRLARGDFAPGWAGYDYGLITGERLTARRPLPVWDGGDIAGRTLLVAAEQGIGDEVMFAGCLPDLLAAEPDARCLVECDDRLVEIYRRSFPGAEVLGNRHREDHGWIDAAGPADCQMAIGSLPRLYRNTASAFPRHAGYLAADPEAVARMRARLDALGPALKVGFSWRGGATPATRAARSIAIEQWAAAFADLDATFVNLQYGDTAAERTAAAAQGVDVADLGLYPLRELDGFSALIAALDVVVTVDNATVHFAGALGTRTFAAIPAAPDWRWMLEREDTPWYPAVRLFRRAPGDGPLGVVARIAGELERLVDDPRA